MKTRRAGLLVVAPFAMLAAFAGRNRVIRKMIMDSLERITTAVLAISSADDQ